LGKSSSVRNENYSIYDPRWVKWIESRDQTGKVLDHTLQIVWQYEDNTVHDLDLWGNVRPQHPQAKGNWVAYVGGPVSAFEKAVGKPKEIEAFGAEFGVRWEERQYKNFEAMVYFFNPKAPIVTRITLHYGPTMDLATVLKGLKIDQKMWKKLDRSVDPNSEAHLRYYLGPGKLLVRNYPLPDGERLEVVYAGPKGQETAQTLIFHSARLKGLVAGAAEFGYKVEPKVVFSNQGTESAWDRTRYMAFFIHEAGAATDDRHSEFRY